MDDFRIGTDHPAKGHLPPGMATRIGHVSEAMDRLASPGRQTLQQQSGRVMSASIEVAHLATKTISAERRHASAVSVGQTADVVFEPFE